jgi:hypothetical protein
MPVTVLLTNTNWWPASAHLAISLEAAGVRVAAAYPGRGHPLAKTAAVAARYVYRATSPLDSLANAIRDSGADWILPCDDRAVSHLHRLHSRTVLEASADKPLADLIERSLGSPAAFPIIASRAALLRTAQAEGIPVPKMSEVSSIEQLRGLSESTGYPCVMKADGSWGGLGVKVVHSLKEAEACFQRMNRPLGIAAMLKRLLVNRDPFWIESWWRRQRAAITVQSYIQGRPANCVVFCKEGKVLAGIAVEVVAAQSLTGPATIVRIVEGRQMLNAAAALAGRLNLSGFHGFDFILEDSTEAAYLLELNPRCAMPCHLRLSWGRDLVGSLYSELSGLPSRKPPLELRGDIVSYFPQAWLLDPKNEVLRTGFDDVPWGEPELLKELLLLPWPDRSFLARTSDRLRNLSFEHRAERSFIFQRSPAAGAGPSSAKPDGQTRGVL